MAAIFTHISCIQGYNVYKDIWNPFVSETLNSKRKVRNPQDPYAVSVKKVGNTIGHVPHVISCIYMLFLRCGSVIEVTVTGPWQYFHDLPQGGLELQCKYRFTGEMTLTEKAHKLLHDEYDGISELKVSFN